MDESMLEFFRVLGPPITVKASPFSFLAATRCAASSRLISGKLNKVEEPRSMD
jgi:hypothetical protein